MKNTFLRLTSLTIFILMGFVSFAKAEEPFRIAESGEDYDSSNGYLDAARMGKWTQDYGRAVTNYKNVLQSDPNNQEAKDSIKEIDKLTSPAIDSKVAFYTDDEDFSMTTYGIFYSMYSGYSMLIKTGYAYTSFSQDDRSLYKNAYNFEMKYRISPKLSGAAGYVFNDYRSRIGDDNAYTANLYFQALRDTGLYFSLGRFRIIDTQDTFSAYGYNIINDIDAAFSDIRTYDYKLALNQKFSENLSFLLSCNLGDYSDNNRKLDIFAELDRIILKDPEVHVKYNYYVLDYSKSSADYWSPDFFDVHTISFEAKNKLTEKLSLVGETSVSYLSEVGNIGYAVIGKLIFQANEDWRMNLSAFYSSSSREGASDFWSTKATFSISRRF